MAFVTLSDAKSHLNITSPANDDELAAVLDAAIGIVEGMVGSLTPASYTESHDGGSTRIITDHQPVMSIQEISEFYAGQLRPLTLQPVGSSNDAFGYSLDDADAGVITRRGAASYAWPFWPGAGNVVITYTAGRTTVPPTIRLAVLVVVAELWGTQRGAAPLPMNGGMAPTYGASGAGWPGSTGIPALARQLCQGSGLMRGPGVA